MRPTIREGSVSHPLIERLPELARQAVVRQLERRCLPRGAALFRQGEPARGVHFIEAGLVQFRIDNAAGDSTFIGIAKRGEYLGDCELLADTPHFAVATALTECRVSLLPRAAFARAMAAHAGFAQAVAERLARSLHLMQLVQVARHQLRAEQIVAAIVLYLARNFGTELSARQVRIDLALSQDQLADMAGVTRQSIHKPLQAWRAAGWIDYHYGHLVLCDQDALLNLVPGENAFQP
jgi:CRP-like cAMP-binding protein